LTVSFEVGVLVKEMLKIEHEIVLKYIKSKRLLKIFEKLVGIAIY
jgi:hypothetical protein